MRRELLGVNRTGLLVLLLVALGSPALAGLPGTLTCPGERAAARLQEAVAVWDPGKREVEIFLFTRKLSTAEVAHCRSRPFPWTKGQPPLARLTLALDPAKPGAEGIQSWSMTLTCPKSGAALRRGRDEPGAFLAGLTAFEADLRDGGALRLRWRTTETVAGDRGVNWDLRLDLRLLARQG